MTKQPWGPVLVLLLLTSPAVGDQIIWVGNQSDHNVLNGAASFHDGINWFNFVPPGADDEAELGMSFDPQENGTAPHYLYLGAFQTNYAAPASDPLIPAEDAVARSVVVYEGLDWTFDLGTNVVEPIDTHGSLTTQTLTVGNPRPDLTPGHAALTLVGDGTIEVTGFANLGSMAGTEGKLVVGRDTTLELGQGILVGYSGTGHLDVENGGTVLLDPEGDGAIFVVGESDGSVGEVFVRGADSSIRGGQQSGLTVGGIFHTPHTGAGSVTIEQGGVVELGNWGVFLGESQATGSLTVQGSGSQLNVDGVLVVSNGGEADLLVRNGAAVSSAAAAIAAHASGSGLATVDGNGSTWQVASDLRVGALGQGELVVSDLGVVEVGSVLTIGRQGAVNVADEGIVNVGSGPTPEPGTVRIGSGGYLTGSGEITGDVIIDGGTVSPGASPGALHITGGYRQLPGSTLSLEIGGTTPGVEYDQLFVSEELTLEGAVQISFINGFLPRIGDTFDLFTASTLLMPASLSFLNAPPAFAYSSAIDNGVFSVTVTAVPEPSGLLMAILMSAAMTMSRRSTSDE